MVKEIEMRPRFQMLAALVLVAAASTPLAVAQRPSADEQALKKEVNAFMDRYWDLWSAGRIDQLVERVYHPFGQLSNRGHSSIEQLKAAFPGTRTALVSAGYGRSQMPIRSVCILSPTVAIVSGRGMRYLTDGNVMGEYGWTYTLIKGADGWRMVSIYSHDPNKALTCSS
jgi:hypothetical protein